MAQLAHTNTTTTIALLLHIYYILQKYNKFTQKPFILSYNLTNSILFPRFLFYFLFFYLSKAKWCYVITNFENLPLFNNVLNDLTNIRLPIIYINKQRNNFFPF